MQPLKIRRLSSIIEESIKELVLTSQLKPGDRLPTEKELSAKFGVSIVTVREALRGLETFGVIEKKRGRDGGNFISSNGNTVKDVVYTFLTSRKFSARDVNEVRWVLQPYSAKLAASRISPELVKALEDNIDYCEKLLRKAGSTITEKEFFDIEERNVEFHRLLGEATGNPILSLTVDYVEDFLMTYKKTVLTPDFGLSQKTVSEHGNILDFIKKGNVEETENAMVHHLKNIEDYLVDKEMSQDGEL